MDAGHRGNIERQGWSLVQGAVPVEMCDRLLSVLADEMGVPVDDPDGWGPYQEEDGIPIWGHQAQWDIRQHPPLHALWSELWGTEALWVTMDMCRFTAPAAGGEAKAMPIHWDHDPHDPTLRYIQGVLALTDTEIGQGGFRCAPAIYADPESWPCDPVKRPWGDEWQPRVEDDQIVHVAAKAGDLIVWDSRLPHANSSNTSDRPRIAFYLHMFPQEGEEERKLRVDLWRTGRCHPMWRWRDGADREEPWPPADLTPLGRRLLGLDPWPD